MRLLRAALLLLVLTPGSAWAAGPTIVSRDVPLGGGRALAFAAPKRFHLVGLHWQGTGTVAFRTRAVGGRWTRWRGAAPEREDRPDAGTAEAARSARWRVGNPYWVGDSDGIEYRVRGHVRRLRAHFVSSPASAIPLRAVSIAGSPAVLRRVSWGANEATRRSRPVFARSLRFALVHHTAGSNSYGPAQSAAIVRAIQLYHVRGNGWNDVGYNFLVDKYGQVFEGRYGGVTRNVVGAHAQGFNTGSVGVALLGNYDAGTATPKAFTALTKLLAWRLDLAHVDPASTLTWISSGNPRFPAGAPVFLRTISGHRDTGFTSCPGGRLYAQLNRLGARVATTGLPKLYAPRVRGSVGGRVRFTARLSGPLPWSVKVRDAAGRAVASGSGTGSSVDWTWDAVAAPRRPYTYSIEAGPTVRPATGTLGGKPVRAPPPPLLGSLTIEPPTLTPSDDYSLVSYRLGSPALVTATFEDANGTTLGTLFSEPKEAGDHSFRFSATGVPDGRYRIVVVATTAAGTQATGSVWVVVSRVLRSFAVAPPAFSPNGDGRLDRAVVTLVLVARVHASVRVVKGTQTVATVYAGPLVQGSHRLTWDGRAGSARAPDGSYRVIVTVGVAPDRPLTLTGPLTLDTRPPRLRLVSLRPLRFWLSERATVVVTAAGRRASLLLGAGTSAFPLSAAGTLRAQARDAAGNRSNPLVAGS